MHYSTLFTLATLGAVASAYQLPDNLKSIYNKRRSGTCAKKLSGTFQGGSSYCGDIPNVVYLKGSSGNYDNMDIDCDGANRSSGDCANDPTGQSQTSFMDTVKTYGIPDLDANIHSYVVFGNVESSPTFDPRSFNIEPLSVMAVVCNNQVFYGVWGDTNGGTSTGEASIALAKLCFPKDHITGDSGHDEKDVLYLAFSGKGALPGKNGANWKAKNAADFQASLKTLGDKLVADLKA